jgi:hypothetical protein
LRINVNPNNNIIDLTGEYEGEGREGEEVNDNFGFFNNTVRTTRKERRKKAIEDESEVDEEDNEMNLSDDNDK